MAIENAAFVERMRTLLPTGWFSNESPILGALLKCLAESWVGLSSNIDYVKNQTRLQSATDNWLDIAGSDYLGSLISRKPDETDNAYRIRIKAQIFTRAATRNAIIQSVKQLAGVEIRIFEPSNCLDTGGWGGFGPPSSVPFCGLSYGSSGGWGSLALPYQVFITVVTTPMAGEPSPIGYGIGGGGYSEGSFVYSEASDLPGALTDDEIRHTILRVLPVNCTAWIRFS